MTDPSGAAATWRAHLYKKKSDIYTPESSNAEYRQQGNQPRVNNAFNYKKKDVSGVHGQPDGVQMDFLYWQNKEMLPNIRLPLGKGFEAIVRENQYDTNPIAGTNLLSGLVVSKASGFNPTNFSLAGNPLDIEDRVRMGAVPAKDPMSAQYAMSLLRGQAIDLSEANQGEGDALSNTYQSEAQRARAARAQGYQTDLPDYQKDASGPQNKEEASWYRKKMAQQLSQGLTQKGFEDGLASLADQVISGIRDSNLKGQTVQTPSHVIENYDNRKLIIKNYYMGGGLGKNPYDFPRGDDDRPDPGDDDGGAQPEDEPGYDDIDEGDYPGGGGGGGGGGAGGPGGDQDDGGGGGGGPETRAPDPARPRGPFPGAVDTGSSNEHFNSYLNNAQNAAFVSDRMAAAARETSVNPSDALSMRSSISGSSAMAGAEPGLNNTLQRVSLVHTTPQDAVNAGVRQEEGWFSRRRFGFMNRFYENNNNNDNNPDAGAVLAVSRTNVMKDWLDTSARNHTSSRLVRRRLARIAAQGQNVIRESPEAMRSYAAAVRERLPNMIDFSSLHSAFSNVLSRMSHIGEDVNHLVALNNAFQSGTRFSNYDDLSSGYMELNDAISSLMSYRYNHSQIEDVLPVNLDSGQLDLATSNIGAVLSTIQSRFQSLASMVVEGGKNMWSGVAHIHDADARAARFQAEQAHAWMEAGRDAAYGLARSIYGRQNQEMQHILEDEFMDNPNARGNEYMIAGSRAISRSAGQLANNVGVFLSAQTNAMGSALSTAQEGAITMGDGLRTELYNLMTQKSPLGEALRRWVYEQFVRGTALGKRGLSGMADVGETLGVGLGVMAEPIMDVGRAVPNVVRGGVNIAREAYGQVANADYSGALAPYIPDFQLRNRLSLEDVRERFGDLLGNFFRLYDQNAVAATLGTIWATVAASFFWAQQYVDADHESRKNMLHNNLVKDKDHVGPVRNDGDHSTRRVVARGPADDAKQAADDISAAHANIASKSYARFANFEEDSLTFRHAGQYTYTIPRNDQAMNRLVFAAFTGPDLWWNYISRSAGINGESGDAVVDAAEQAALLRRIFGLPALESHFTGRPGSGNSGQSQRLQELSSQVHSLATNWLEKDNLDKIILCARQRANVDGPMYFYLADILQDIYTSGLALQQSGLYHLGLEITNIIGRRHNMNPTRQVMALSILAMGNRMDDTPLRNYIGRAGFDNRHLVVGALEAFGLYNRTTGYLLSTSSRSGSNRYVAESVPLASREIIGTRGRNTTPDRRKR